MICRWCGETLVYGCGQVMHADLLSQAIIDGNLANAHLCADKLHAAMAEADLGMLDGLRW